jgi:hypothetical protein
VKSEKQILCCAQDDKTKKRNARAEARAFENQRAKTKHSLLIFLPPEVRCVLFLEARPLFWKVIASIDSRNRAHRNASATINALDRIDEELVSGVRTCLVRLGVDAVHRASVHTRPVFSADTRFSDHIRHLKISLVKTRPMSFVAVDHDSIKKICALHIAVDSFHAAISDSSGLI